ncbi:hypothetical protein OSB04_013382 [Centaurea solstitialis]|uniref:Uncharacterized protein n=1 Tax=Centaurea solstitialis TaxID=347529 RepID=A0AA38TKQ2_9ASTR|nr:hypothetical protein OSB04_013382 [Centaurea solstitialis]
MRKRKTTRSIDTFGFSLLLAVAMEAARLVIENDIIGTSNPRSRGPNKNRGREKGHEKLVADYFSDNPVYNDGDFKRRFRMTRRLFLRIVADLEREFDYFSKHGMQEARKYLRKPTASDIQAIYALHEEKLGLPDMLGSIDCMHWYWKNCPLAWRGQFHRGDHAGPSIILEAVASYDQWIWHAFGILGATNDIIVVTQSPIFTDIFEDKAPDSSFVVNDTNYKHGYYLADGIYMEWTMFVKSFRWPTDERRIGFTKRKESARKDIERTFRHASRKMGKTIEDELLIRRQTGIEVAKPPVVVLVVVINNLQLLKSSPLASVLSKLLSLEPLMLVFYLQPLKPSPPVVGGGAKQTLIPKTADIGEQQLTPEVVVVDEKSASTDKTSTGDKQQSSKENDRDTTMEDLNPKRIHGEKFLDMGKRLEDAQSQFLLVGKMLEEAQLQFQMMGKLVKTSVEDFQMLWDCFECENRMAAQAKEAKEKANEEAKEAKEETEEAMEEAEKANEEAEEANYNAKKNNDIANIPHTQFFDPAAKKGWAKKTFATFQEKWHVVDRPARTWKQRKLRDIMYACIILHNMIREDGGFSHYPFDETEVVVEDIETNIFEEDRAINVALVKNREKHANLCADLSQHVWNSIVNVQH